MRRAYKMVLISLFIAAVVYGLGCGLFLIRFPSEIRLTEYTTHRLAFGAPFRATVTNETAAVFRVNEKPVDNAVMVNLQEPLVIETDAGGLADMTINAFGFPVKKVSLEIIPDLDVVPCGMTIGVRINTNGVMVLNSSSFKDENGQSSKPCEGKLKPGDLILRANGRDMKNKEDLTQAIIDSTGDITFHLRRDGEELDVVITPLKSAQDEVNRIGVWVRDSTQGIGTITYYNPATHTFGALGHGIMDVDTKKLMSVKNGIIMSSKVTAVKKGAKGMPGELEGAVEREKVLGQIKINSPHGIYGTIDADVTNSLPTETVKVAMRSQIHEGPAVIRTSVASGSVKEYDIYVENVNYYATDETKGIVIRITDPELLKLTNGIVQGMSGSPILQDGRIIGAVTHVFVQDPTKGYGIFIENMIKQEQSINV